MLTSRLVVSSGWLRAFFLALFGVWLVAGARAQTTEAPYARKNAFGMLFQFSNDSSHILMGTAEQRKLLNIGASYSRRLLLTRFGSWQYDAEILPVALESDPLTREVITQSSPTPKTIIYDFYPSLASCSPITQDYSYEIHGVTYSGTITESCHGRQWNIGEGMSPLGMRWNLLPHRTIQPVLEGHGGYMYSTQPIPVAHSGSFNFTFDFGVGFEFFRSHSRSVRIEYRYHHISNDDTATYNPGIDNGVLHLSYVFGR